MENRKQCVEYQGTKSRFGDITCSVSQGSVLGQLLFIIYKNDMPNSFNYSNGVSFEDVITLCHSGENNNRLQSVIENDLDHFDPWFRANKLSLNVEKTPFMLLRHQFMALTIILFHLKRGG